MKFHKNLVDAIVKTLVSIFDENRYADKAIEYLFKDQPKWGGRDRRFVAETIYDVVRQYRLLNELDGNKKNWYHIVGIYLLLRGHDLPAWDEFAGIDKKHLQQKISEIQNNRAIFQSVPDWMDELGFGELSYKWNKELEALNNQAAVVLRGNTLKTSTQNLQNQLSKEGIETERILDTDALILKERKNIFTSQLFKQGLFEIQDASSQLVASFLRAAEGQTIIDACAGAGGKTLHIAALTQNKSKVIAMDIEEKKLTELQRRARRAGAKIESKLISGPKTIKDLNKTADRLLLDVPCSGLGVLKRNPDAKWKLSLERINELKKIQQQILQDYTCMLKVGGLMVYATCSILPSENNEQVQQFLAENPAFSFIEDKTIYPSEGFDGFYMCLMQRNA
ncbi:MAG TPA: class I SAM-dependent methyltransferase [Bacteroidia bacterium]|nr:class I SAM-dependent methyltransferase [Bacteroidia bacterium]